MKKFFSFISVAFILATLSFSTFAADPFTQLIREASTAPNSQCPYPPSDPGSWCPCMDAAMIAGCKQHLPAPDCTIPRIKAQVRSIGVQTVCARYSPVPQDECVTDVNYFMASC